MQQKEFRALANIDEAQISAACQLYIELCECKAFELISVINL